MKFKFKNEEGIQKMSFKYSKYKVFKTLSLVMMSILIIFSTVFTSRLEKNTATAKSNDVAWQNNNGEIKLGTSEEDSTLVYSKASSDKFGTFEESEKTRAYEKVTAASALSADEIKKIKNIIYNGYGSSRLKGTLSDDAFYKKTQQAIWKVFNKEATDETGMLEAPENLQLAVYKNAEGSILVGASLMDGEAKVDLSKVKSSVYLTKKWTESDDDSATFELQTLTASGEWKLADVKDATKTIEADEDEKDSTVVWKDVSGYPSDYRIVEKSADRDEIVSDKGNGTKENPFVIERKVSEKAENIMSDFLRANAVSTSGGKTGKFTLKKLDEQGKSLAGAKFTLANGGDYKQEKTSTNDKTGITFDNIPTGTYTLKEVEAPAGYEVAKDYYTITVDTYGIAQAKYVSTASDDVVSGAKPASTTTVVQPRSTQPRAVQAAKTSGVVTVESYDLKPSATRQSSASKYPPVWATSGDLMTMTFKLKVNDGTKPGDSFTIKLDDKLSPTGIRERILPPVPLTANGEVAATGVYDRDSNSFIYTFTDYIRYHKNVTLTATYNTFGADIAKVLNSGDYEFVNEIDGQKQAARKFYIDYGPSREMPSGWNKGLKMRNQVASVNRVDGTVERIIYLNNGNTDNDYVSNGTWADHTLTLKNNSQDSTITNVEVYRVLKSQKSTYMADSMPGRTDGLEKLSNQYNPETHKIQISKSDFEDKKTGLRTAGILVKVTEKLSNLRGQTNIEATWGYTSWGSTSVSASASVVDTGASSSGDAERWSPTISLTNKKIVEEKEKEFSLEIFKRDAADETIQDLKATFGLYDKDGKPVTDSSGKQQTGQTDKDKHLTFNNIKAGTYTLKEENAPTGYHKIKDLKITIDKDGKATVEGDDKDLVKVENATSDKATISLTVKNIKKSEYPLTGGIGSHIFILGGLALILIASTRKFYNKK